MIALSCTIGVGVAANAGEILALAGPAPVIIAYFLFGLIACFVMDGICEMIVLWPVANPMVQFVKYFIDRDLAIVVGFAYWYAMM
jgi:amino acid permease